MYDKKQMYEKKHAFKHIQMYDKKQAYKCMIKNRHAKVWKKTGIQMYEKKQAYKCMKKTCIQTHTNVW